MARLILIGLFLLCTLNASASVVKVTKSSDGWRLLVDGQPYFVKGVSYVVSKVSESAHDHTMRDWAIVDDDHDSTNDFAEGAWVDANRNNQRDPDENAVGDFQLLKDMGVNTIRLYHHSSDDPALIALTPQQPLIHNAPNKELYRKLFDQYGIRIIMGDLLGAYAVGSGADWNAGTDYRDPTQRANMLKSVEVMVQDFKDEPYLLMWVLGNENNMQHSFTQTNSQEYPEAFAKFVNEAARLIHKLDPHHPVCLVNAETQSLWSITENMRPTSISSASTATAI